MGRDWKREGPTSVDDAPPVSCLPARPNKVGRRRSKFCAETVEIILDALMKGALVKHALALARVDIKTWENWLHQGKVELEYLHEDDEMSLLSMFYEDVQWAKAYSVMDLIEKMNASLKRDSRNWQALFTLYDRLHSEDFGQKQAISVQQDTTVKVIIERRGGQEWLAGKKIEEVIDTEMIDQKMITGGDFE